MALLSVLIVIFSSRYQCRSPQTKKIGMNFYHQSYSRIARHLKRQLGIRLSTSFMYDREPRLPLDVNLLLSPTDKLSTSILESYRRCLENSAMACLAVLMTVCCV